MKKTILAILTYCMTIICICSVSTQGINILSATEEQIVEEENFEATAENPEVSLPTSMDASANIYKGGKKIVLQEESENKVYESDFEDNSLLRAQTVATGVVNFKTKAVSLNTEYTEVSSGRLGYTNGSYGADGAYLEHSSDGKRVKFIQSGVIGWVNASEVQVLNYNSSSVQSCNYYAVRNGRLYHFITVDVTQGSYANMVDVGPAPSYLSIGTAYYSYDGHYFYTKFVTMIEDYRVGTHGKSVNATQPHYNYYQYLSHRTKTSFTAQQMNSRTNNATSSASSKMKNMGQYFIDYQNVYGSNAVLMYAVAANESAWGNSLIAQSKNNLFGHAAYDSSAGSSATGYFSPQLSIYSHARYFISQDYLDPCDGVNAANGFNPSVCLRGRYYGGHLGDKASGINVKYASDPYWGEKAAAVAWSLEAQTNYTQKDNERYSLGMKKESTNVSVRSGTSIATTLLYQTGAVSHYPFTILGEISGQQIEGSNKWYRIQSSPVLNEGRTKMLQDVGEFIFGRDYAYVHSNSLTKISEGKLVCEMDPGIKPTNSNIVYQANVEDYCWQPWKLSGETSGVTGEAKRLEGVRIDLNGMGANAKIAYRTHVQNYGWQSWSSNGAVNGKTGTDKRIEAIQIRLENLLGYEVEYRTHIQDIGWQEWKKGGEISGTVGLSKRIEAIQMRIVRTANVPNFIQYQTHIQTIGWQALVADGQLSGTSGQSKRLEAIKLNLNGTEYSGNLLYQTHIENIGWQDWKQNGELSGTQSQNKRLEAIKIKLDGEIANQYDIYYRVHAEGFGWLDWTKNGAQAGSEGFKYRLEGIEVKLVKKGATAPTPTLQPFYKIRDGVLYQSHIQTIGWQAEKGDTQLSGTSGYEYRVEALKLLLEGLNYAGSIEYAVDLEGLGWQTWKKDGAVAGTQGQKKRLEGIKVKLSGEVSNYYDVYYRVHISKKGWLGWTKNGAMSGSTGYDYQIEAVQVRLVKKGSTAPNTITETYYIKQ